MIPLFLEGSWGPSDGEWLGILYMMQLALTFIVGLFGLAIYVFAAGLDEIVVRMRKGETISGLIVFWTVQLAYLGLGVFLYAEDIDLKLLWIAFIWLPAVFFCLRNFFDRVASAAKQTKDVS